MQIPKIKKIVEKTLDQNKAVNIVSINLKGKTSIADYMVIASGTSSRHIQSMSEILLKELQKRGMTVEDNLRLVLEMTNLTNDEQKERLEKLIYEIESKQTCKLIG